MARRGVWLERFQLLDSHPSLSAEAYEHWEKWRRALASHIALIEGGDHNDAVPMAVAGACHGVFLAELRNRRNEDESREDVLNRLDESLTPCLRSPQTAIDRASARLIGHQLSGLVVVFCAILGHLREGRRSLVSL